MRILVSNDDGINAPGLKVAEHIAHSLSDDVWVVAPETEQSGASHSLTLTNPMRIMEHSHRRYGVAGTPTDCVMLAVNHIIDGAKPDLVISGVNRGGNLGEDVTYSGTVAVAMEGTLLGIRSIALSQAYSSTRQKVKWKTAETHGPDLVRRLVDTGWASDSLININFPDVNHGSVKGVELTTQGRRDVTNLEVVEREDGRGKPYYWYGFRARGGSPKPGGDLHAVANALISVTPLRLDLTDYNAHQKLIDAWSRDSGVESHLPLVQPDAAS